MTTFTTNDTRYKHRNGQGVEVLSKITKPDKNHDIEVLPMYKIKFNDGLQIEVWEDEIA